MIHALPETVYAEKLFDLSLIEKASRGNELARRKMILAFAQSIPAAIQEMIQAYCNRDFGTIQKIAHRIKPILAIYAIVKLDKDIRQIEKLAKERQSIPELGLRIDKLTQVIEQVVEQLKQEYLNN